jgi:hypothetical protein
MCSVWGMLLNRSSNIPHTKHIVYAAAPWTSSLLQHWTTHHITVTTVLHSWRWAKDCPKHVELIRRSIKLLLLHIVGHLYYSPILMMHSQTQIKKNWFYCNNEICSYLMKIYQIHQLRNVDWQNNYRLMHSEALGQKQPWPILRHIPRICSEKLL